MKLVRLLLVFCLAAAVLGCDDSPTRNDNTAKVLAIVDVMTLNNNETVPPGYTGIAFSECTDPYIPSLTGEWTQPSDVNKGIGGDTKYIWVKYEKISVTSSQPVLVDAEVAHWPYWVPSYPEGWEPAGPLTTGTWGDCWRNGLIVKYLPLDETGVFISTLCLSITGDGNQNSCPDSTYTNEVYAAREQSYLDIHRGCGDGTYVYLSFYRPAVRP